MSRTARQAKPPASPSMTGSHLCSSKVSSSNLSSNKVGQAVSPAGPRLGRIFQFGLAILLFLTSAARAQHGAVDPAFFAAKVYPILESAQCRACHATDGVASGTRLHF